VSASHKSGWPTPAKQDEVLQYQRAAERFWLNKVAQANAD